ncbi:hypothetical protein HK097_003817 [Rhizophlyctis rosea]|uniref:Helicase ATP-binding domain-containing protein n=1 Tax=Rhizophlyctis rosea TaxID=64517 RepID=A0AAD5SEH8_9FUNG|nr:hypothetical protein HK097_003817 [Rhizophlyctis rosea]
MTFIEGMSLDNTTNIDDFRFAPIPQTQSLYQSTDRTTKTYQILPFSHPYLDRYLPTLDNQLVTIAPEDLTQIHGPTGVTHREHRHWHNKREITATPSTSSLTSRQKMKLLRAEQKYHSQLQKYAASLTGANGRGLTPVVVPEVKAGSKQKSAKEKSVSEKSEKGGKKAGKEKAGKGLSKADQIRANNTADKAKKVEKKSIDLWKSQYKELEKMENPHAALNHLETLLSKDSTDPAIRMELNLAKFSILVSLAKSDEDCAKLLYFTTPLLQSSDLSSESCTFLYKGLKQLNLHNCIDKVDIKSLQSRDFVVKLKPPTARTTILDSSTRFQLLHGGPFMQRSVDSKKDGRVGFEPDPWQVEVLDILDKDESLIVCAPTSAGKTFIAFYAMEKVLRGSNDGVIVYVAPTKALVNQIAAEIHARFSKAYSTGWSMWAIHTRDYRVHNPLTCQVLVTVPAILQIMLLSPHNAEWRSRVKRVILDEVHCIGEMEGGSVWEQLLLLSTSSIIALSATIGNPNEFHQWLESIQKVQNRKLHLVEHKQRYSDLRKFVYIPSTTSKTLKSLDFSSKSSALSFVHPVAAVDPEASSLPKELSLEARDCLLLYDAMRKVALPQDLRKLDKLDPETYFAKIPHIRKPDCLKYERKLKEVLAGWIGGDKGRFSGVIQELRKGVVEEMDALEVNWKDGQDVYGQQFWLDTVTDLTGDLRGQGLLPAIYFHYDRTGCNKLAERLFNDLESAEKEFRRTDRAWLAKVEEYEEWIAGAKERAKARERREKAKGKKGGEAEDVGEDDDESGGPANPYRADPAFSLAGEKTGYTLTELEEAIVQLKPVMSGQMFLLQALRRGIAVHHAGCNKRYLQLVEMLFRRKFLSVVIATGTLALGINMPCKTVVFVGDSVYLTVLNYRQGSGRAGRRGFDLLGNVVFHGCTLSKVFRLMQARLPDITGHFPLTTTLTLRLLQLFTELQNYKGKNREKYLEQSRAMVASLFEQPFLFSIEYLRREGLIDADGAPLDMAGLTSHLFYIEPANFAFGALFRGGIFHRVCKTIDSNRQGTLHALMHILCHLFGRLERKPSTKESALERIKNSPSRVILEPLPEYAARVLRKHDDRVLETYTAYISSYVCQFRDRLGVDNRLPLSGKVVGADSKGAESEDEGSLVRKLGETAIPLLARSTFSALSGWGDEFRSVEDLTASVRNGVFLEVSAIPTMSKLVSRPVSEPAVLDAYLLDFFNHGQVEALIRGNGIRRGDIWFLLDAFHYNLRSITVGLEVWLKKLDHEAADELDGGEVDDWEDDDDSGIGESISTKKSDAVDDDTWKVYRAFKLLEQEFMEKFKKMWA